MAEPRTAKQVIDQAIKENRPGEYLCYGFAVVFVFVGVLAVGRSLFAEQPAVVTVVGAVFGSLFWPAMNSSRQIRRENLAIRLLEVPLSRAGSAEEGATMLQKAFVEVFVKGGGSNA